MPSITTFAPVLYSTMALPRYRYELKYQGSCEDRSAEFFSFGRGTALEDFQHLDFQVAPVADTGQTHTAEEVMIRTRSLEPDQDFFKSYVYRRRQLLQNIPNAMLGGNEASLRQFLEQSNDYIRGIFDAELAKAGNSSRVNTLTHANDNLGDNDWTIKVLDDLNMRREDKRLAGAAGYMGDVHLPERAITQIVRYLTVVAPNLGAGIMVDQAFTNGSVPNVYGWNLMGDENMNISGAGTGKFKMRYLVRGAAMDWVKQLDETNIDRKVGESNIYQDVHWIYGAGVKEPTLMWLTQTTLS